MGQMDAETVLNIYDFSGYVTPRLDPGSPVRKNVGNASPIPRGRAVCRI